MSPLTTWISTIDQQTRDGTLPRSAPVVARYLYGYWINERAAFPSQQRIADAVRCTRRTVTRVIKALRDAGLLTTTRLARALSYRPKCLMSPRPVLAQPSGTEGGNVALRYYEDKVKNASPTGEDDVEREPFFEDGAYSAEEYKRFKKAETKMFRKWKFGLAQGKERDAPPPSDQPPERRKDALAGDPVLDALDGVEYNGGKGIGARGKVAAATKRLWRDEYERVTGKRLVKHRTPPGEFKRARKQLLAQEVQTRAKRYIARWPDREITSTALVTYWDHLTAEIGSTDWSEDTYRMED